MRQISEAAHALVGLGLLSWDRVARIASLPISPEFNQVALDPRSRYEAVFVEGLRLRHFNFCLADFSFFQLSLSDDVRRYCFYPNPFVLDDQLLELLDDPSDFGAFDVSELIATNRRSPVRYDVSPGAYRPYRHPYAHFHLGHGELGRLASRRILEPTSFCLFMAQMFYTDAWRGLDFDPPNEDGFSNLLEERLARLISEQGELGETQFDPGEARLFHIR